MVASLDEHRTILTMGSVHIFNTFIFIIRYQ